MSTSDDARAHAAGASTAMRDLASEIGNLDHARDIYPILADLRLTSFALFDVLTQFASVLSQHREHATDYQGNHHVGDAAAWDAITGLREAAHLVSQMETVLEETSLKAGSISWPSPEPVPTGPRFVNIVFLQGDDADHILALIEERGADAAIEHLAGSDFGEETVNAAIANGHTYDEAPAGSLDRTAQKDAYTLVYNPFMGHVGLYRETSACAGPTSREINHAPTVPQHPASPDSASVPRRERLGAPDLDDDGASATAARGFGR